MAIRPAEEIKRLVTVINNLTGYSYYVERAYGRPRLYLEQSWSGLTKEVSPRLTSRELRWWMEGFIAGLDVKAGRE